MFSNNGSICVIQKYSYAVILIQNTWHTFTICSAVLSSCFCRIVFWTFYALLLQIVWLIFSDWTWLTDICCFVAICSIITYSWNQTVLFYVMPFKLLTFKVRDIICRLELTTKRCRLDILQLKHSFAFGNLITYNLTHITVTFIQIFNQIIVNASCCFVPTI